ncbi:hypothetical protein JAAARDRAFT_140077 [Jaapia argillacea MUCL 33604]|uniref:Uncharacterized protein n=1 Tax=Jaapia argillacea MUCL 33604 TaxID=933084 RepID=A0A067P9I6_9AGAM|nr:hypothetical protein JAAARDRAFT_140077 [Jaapia argillacea MUCL 33604]
MGGGGGGGGRGDGVFWGEGSLSGLEVAARDAICRVLANPDVQNAADSIRSGALKVSCDFWGRLVGSWIESELTSTFFR